MGFQVTTTFTNKNPDTIYNRLATKLGREPSHDEIVAELNRILADQSKKREARRNGR